MNKWETLYNDELKMSLQVGAIRWYDFEPMRLKLAEFTTDGEPRTIWYTPDFGVMEKTGELWFAEVKGFWREAARVRIKLAASKFPFRFVAITRDKCEWKKEEFRNS
jgi:hypothetical protein